MCVIACVSTSCIPNRYVVPGRYTYVPTMGDVDGPRRDRRPQRRPSNASNAVWSLTLCFIRVSDHLFVSRPPTRAKLAPYGLRRGLCVFDLYCLNVTTCHCPGIAILRSAPYCRPWVVGLGGGGSALVPLNTRRTCTSPSFMMTLLLQLFRGYHSLYGVTVSHRITHHQAA